MCCVVRWYFASLLPFNNRYARRLLGGDAGRLRDERTKRVGAGFTVLVSFISMPICLTKNRRTQKLLERREVCDGVSSRLCWIFGPTRADGPDATTRRVDGLRAILRNICLGPVHGLGPVQEAAGWSTLWHL